MKFKKVECVIPISNHSDLAEICCHHENLKTRESWHEKFFMDFDGNIVARFESTEPFWVEQLTQQSKNLFIRHDFFNDNEYKIIRIEKDQSATILHSYQDIESGVEDGCFAVKKNNLWGFINEDATEIIPPQYTGYRSFYNGIAVALKNGLWNYINKKNEILKPLENNDIETYDNNLQDEPEKFPKPVQKANGKFVLINEEGKEISKEYDYIEDFLTDKFFKIKRGKHYGYLHKNGSFVIKPQFHKWSEPFYGGFAIVVNHDLSKAIINTTGEIILKIPEKQRTFNLGNGSMLLENVANRNYDLVKL